MDNVITEEMVLISPNDELAAARTSIGRVAEYFDVDVIDFAEEHRRTSTQVTVTIRGPADRVKMLRDTFKIEGNAAGGGFGSSGNLAWDIGGAVAGLGWDVLKDWRHERKDRRSQHQGPGDESAPSTEADEAS